ncbi:MAG: hypothetical protein SXV54_11025 [Chloroflexota bacterium]|nr:hypothetical protein [Chloroflexota bacterium]
MPGRLCEITILITSHFVRPDNRFRVTAKVENDPLAVHLPNPGRLTELLPPDRTCGLTEFDSLRRKTRLDLRLVECANTCKEQVRDS